MNHASGEVSSLLSARLECALSILSSSPSLCVVFSGGCSWTKSELLPTEAEIMESWMINRWSNSSTTEHLPLPVMLTENNSTSTYTNAVNTLTMLAHDHPRLVRLLLVTNTFHSYRAYHTFVRVAKDLFSDYFHIGITVPEYNEETVTQWDWLREFAALMLYTIRGFV